MSEAEETLRLARLTVETLYGTERVDLEARCAVEADRRAVVVDTSTEISRALATIFLGLVRREFGSAAVSVETAGRADA
jgi:hypothetical protein